MQTAFCPIIASAIAGAMFASLPGRLVTVIAATPATVPTVAGNHYAGCLVDSDFSPVVSQGPECQSGRQFVLRLRNKHDLTVAPPDTTQLVAATTMAAAAATTAAPAVSTTAPYLAAQCASPTQRQHIELYYAHFAGQPDRFGTYAADIVQQFNDVDGNYMNYDGSHYFGKGLHLYVECSGGALVVHDIALSTPLNQSNFSTIVSDLQAQGHCYSSQAGGCAASMPVHYWIWTDGNPTAGYAGQSSVIGDDSVGLSNAINSNDGYSINYGFTDAQGGAGVFAHENGHAMGAVQLSAPDSTGAWHCTDGRDVMCYNDGGPNGGGYRNTVCPATPNGTNVFDCNFNDYFNEAPAPGTYLSSHWNIGNPNNQWILFLPQGGWVVTLAASQSTAAYGQPVTLTADIYGSNGPGNSGSATFFDGGSELGTAPLNGGGQATLATTALGLGNHSITAQYASPPSTSNAVSVQVTKALSQTTLQVSPSPAAPGSTVTLTVSVIAQAPSTGVPTGSVTFSADASPLNTVALSAGSASMQTSWSNNSTISLSVAYGGDAHYNASVSSSQNLRVAPLTTTVISSSASSNTAPLGTPLTFNASVRPQSGSGTITGTITFKDGAVALTSQTINSGGTVEFSTSTLGPGRHAINAVYSGDANYAGSTGTLNETVVSGGPGVSLTYAGQEVAFWEDASHHLLQTWTTPDGTAAPYDWTAQWGGTGLLASSPTVTEGGDQTLVFWQGTNNDLWQAWYDPSAGWSGPVDWTTVWGVGGKLASAPTVMESGDQTLVFWRGINNDLWQAWYTPGFGWSGPVDWEAQWHGPSNIASQPSVTESAGGQTLVFWEGSDNDLWQAWYTIGLGWSGPVDWSASWGSTGTVASTPSVMEAPGFQTHVFWQGVNGDLWQAWFTPGLGWSGAVDWNALWGVVGNMSSNPSVSLDGGSQTIVFWQGSNQHLWEAWYTPGVGWSGPVDFTPAGGQAASVGTAPSVVMSPNGIRVLWLSGSDHLIEMLYAGGWIGPADWGA